MLEFIKTAILNTVSPIATIALAALVGYRMSSRWAESQKRRELELALANSFYSSYGEFCAIWKLWNCVLKDLPANSPQLLARRESLLERASEAEGTLEAALLKVAAERKLQPDEQANLGNLRQAFQLLRERIQSGERISYGYSQHPDYVEFKRLATWFGVLLASPSASHPTAEESHEAFLEITHNKHEPRWKKAGRSKADAAL